MAIDLATYARRSTVQLTTVGRTSGQRRTVKIWFVVAGPGRIAVQHVRPPLANWYKNLVKTPAVEVDFGSGPLAARATPVTDRGEINSILAAIRHKYLIAWLLQAFGTRHAVAAEIDVKSGGK